MDRPKTGTGRGSKSKTPQFPDDLYILGPKGTRIESTETKRPLPVPAKPGPSNPLIGKTEFYSVILEFCRFLYDLFFFLKIVDVLQPPLLQLRLRAAFHRPRNPNFQLVFYPA